MCRCCKLDAGVQKWEDEGTVSSNHAGPSASSELRNSVRQGKQHTVGLGKSSESRSTPCPDPATAKVQEPTIEGLQRFHPQHVLNPVSHVHRYKQIYKTRRDSLERSFTRDQLHCFVSKLLRIAPSRRSRKGELLDLMLLKAWGLPSPAQLEDECRERTEKPP